MSKPNIFVTQIFCSLIFSAVAFAQPLPKIELKPFFPNLQIDRPVWMSQAPDGSGRFFVIAQAGTLLEAERSHERSHIPMTNGRAFPTCDRA